MASKLGIHVNFIREADAMRDFILSARPVVVKTLHHDPGFWGEIKAEYPELLLIGRRYMEKQPLDNPNQNASDMAGKLRGMSTAHICDAWEGYNEISRTKLVALCKFDRLLAGHLHDEGMKYVAGSWSVGVPEPSDWERPEMLDALYAADYAGVHAYFAPRMADPRGWVWWMLRHRLWYDSLPTDCRLPLIITECGIDSGAPHFDPGAQGGWRSFTDARGYLEDCIWYDLMLQDDPYVVGATIFQWGALHSDTEPDWRSYDLGGEMAELLKLYLIHEHGEPEPPPADDEWMEYAHYLEDKLGRIHQIVEES